MPWGQLEAVKLPRRSKKPEPQQQNYSASRMKADISKARSRTARCDTGVLEEEEEREFRRLQDRRRMARAGGFRWAMRINRRFPSGG